VAFFSIIKWPCFQLTKTRVALLNTVPSAMRELLRQRGVSVSLHVVNLAGELLQPALVADIYAQTRAEQRRR